MGSCAGDERAGSVVNASIASWEEKVATGPESVAAALPVENLS